MAVSDVNYFYYYLMLLICGYCCSRDSCACHEVYNFKTPARLASAVFSFFLLAFHAYDFDPLRGEKKDKQNSKVLRQIAGSPLRLLVSRLPCFHFVHSAGSLGSSGVFRFSVVDVDDRFAGDGGHSLPPFLKLFLGAHEEAK